MADGFASGRGEQTAQEVQARAAALVGEGVEWVMLRDHAASPETFAAEAHPFAARLRAIHPDVRLAVNTHLDVASAFGADGHVGERGPSPEVARGTLRPGSRLGVSLHAMGEVSKAVAAGADYLLFAPVFPTASKPGHPGTGLETLADIVEAAGTLPVLALGGITPDRVASCLDAGAHGVAVLSGLLDAPDPRTTLAAYLNALLR
ncbi:MAG TPA: thiamine phosphate synthase [Rubricoccaceae bacterium]|nr:thiamine phosphate synthase [Rubricoccaceae bacterium]